MPIGYAWQMIAARPARIPELRLDPACVAPAGTHDHLLSFIARNRRVAVVTGAGCSTRSGIPAYRDASGQWLRRSPVFYQDFLRQADMRRRYWARSFFGWPRITEARPGAAHEALARLSRTGHFHVLKTGRRLRRSARRGSACNRYNPRRPIAPLNSGRLNEPAPKTYFECFVSVRAPDR